MINTLSIRNFKSITELDIKPKRLNLFIGEHNSGKSNILEALSWFSLNSLIKGTFQEIFRFKTAADFFYDHDVSTPLQVQTDSLSFILRYGKNQQGALYNHFEGLLYRSNPKVNPMMLPDFYDLNNKNGLSDFHAFELEFNGDTKLISGNMTSNPFRMYQFKRPQTFNKNSFRPFLEPPFGDNIPTLVVSNKQYRKIVSDVFEAKKFRLMVKPVEGEIDMAKDTGDELYSYPYISISETMQRIIFYTLAIETNKNAILIMDEPESNTFPMYTKEIAELMALDKDNQYFIATHNPYLLGSIVSKTPVKELAVFVTEMDNYKTKVTLLKEKQLSTLLDKGVDVFFNLDKLVGK